MRASVRCGIVGFGFIGPHHAEAMRRAKFADARGIRLAIEMHPGFLVYNPETALKLREAAGETIGVNLDPSHLFWLGIDVAAAVRKLAGCIFHCHAKDTLIDRRGPSAALRSMAILPCIVTVVFAGIWLHDRSRGGYRVVHLDAESISTK